MNVYVDGSLAEQAPQTEAILNTQNPMNVAMCGCHEYAGAGFDGRMSEVSKTVGGPSEMGGRMSGIGPSYSEYGIYDT